MSGTMEEQRAEQRAAKIRHCRQELEKLQNEQRRDMLRVRLADCPEHIWGNLTDEQKADKELVLAVLSKEPDFFGSDTWNEETTGAPTRPVLATALRQDGDILLAALEGCSERTIPEFLTDDKNFMVKACAIDGELLKQASDRLKDDEDVVLAALDELPYYEEDVFEVISERLRGEKAVLLKTVEVSVHGFFWLEFMAPHTDIQVQRDVALAVSKKINHTDNAFYDDGPFDYLDESIRDDKEVMLPFVRSFGYALNWCSTRLQSDEEVVRVAIENHPSALEFARGAIRDMLFQDVKIMRSTISNNEWEGGYLLVHAADSMKQDRDMVLAALKNGLAYRDIPTPFRTDRECALEGLKYSVVSFAHLDDSFQEDRAFALDAVKRQGRVYETLPPHFQQDEQIAMEAVKQGFFECIHDFHVLAFRNVPSLLRSKEAITALANKRCIGDGVTFFEVVGSSPLLDDREIVLSACACDPNFFQHVREQLRWDRDIVLASLQSYRTSFDKFPISTAPADFMESNIDIVVKIINVAKQKEDVLHLIPRSCYRKGAVVLALLVRGWISLGELHPNSSFLLHRTLVSAAVRSHWRDFCYANRSLTSDRDFVLSLMKIDGRALKFANESLKRDNEILMEAIKSKGAAAIALCFSDRDFEFLASFAMPIRQKLHVFDTFVRVFLGGIHQLKLGCNRDSLDNDTAVADRILDPKAGHMSTTNSEVCHLPMLDCGDETATALKRKIAEFIGVPLGDELCMLRLASLSLAKCGF